MTTPIRKSKTILLADDEPYNLEWIVEFLTAKHYKALICTTVDEALATLKSSQFRAVVADLSIPIHTPPSLQGEFAEIKAKYPGLLLAEYARHHGHLDRQVIVYSVHDDPLVRAYTEKIRCTYLLKGRPRQFKEELKDVFTFDPIGHKHWN